MNSKKILSIWVGNLEFDLIDRVKKWAKEQYPKVEFRTHSADAYSGPSDIGKPDLVFVQSRYRRIFNDHSERGYVVITEAVFEEPHETERPISGRSESDEAGANDNPHPQTKGIEVQDEAGLFPPVFVSEGDGLANAGPVHVSRGRAKPRRKT
jgi:hypothetical protein